MALTIPEIDERIAQLQDGIDSVSEVQFEGESTKYRSIKEIERGIIYYTKLKQNVTATTTRKTNRFRPVHVSICRGL